MRLAVLFLAASFGAAQQSDVPTFRARVNLINVTFTASDSSGKLVQDLSQQEVTLFEDNVPQTVRYFARTSELPLAIGIVVDASDSQSKFVKKHARDLSEFLQDVLGPSDRAFLIGFGNHIRMVSDFGATVPEMLSQFERYTKSVSAFPDVGPKEVREEGTALHDTVYYAAEKLKPIQNARRVLVVFSDGQDNASAHDEVEALEQAQQADVLTYAVRYTERSASRFKSRDKYGVTVMRRLAQNTGGRDYDTQAEDMHAVFRSIADELHALYEVGYYSSDPARDRTFRKVKISISRPDIKARAKPGYFATP